jgi:ABC-type branched-subunit amino acid transport system ATPase component
VSILRLADVRREVGTFVILDSITAAIALGDRIGLVGPNGAGKTTLLGSRPASTSPTAARSPGSAA